MSQYQRLDDLILERLVNESLFLTQLFSGEARKEAIRLSICTSAESFRIFDRRLQALRKAGKIVYVNGSGWGRI